MFDIVLYEPEIPPNTGNVMRLAANIGAQLHLVRPLGFTLVDRRLARAGMDYRDAARVLVHNDWPSCQQHFAGRRMFAVTTRGTQRYDLAHYLSGDVFVFGPETRGLPAAVIDALPGVQRLQVPMVPANRSLNLANAVAVVLYEAWRQTGYSGASVAVPRPNDASSPV